MLSYLHGFHAGNFADVHKHAALVLAIRMMQAKPAGIACFDTHAGSASYDLDGERALKTGEAAFGIHRVWAYRQHLQGQDWRAMLAEMARCEGGDGRLRAYPGSPLWLSRYLREQDRLTAFELHPAEGRTLAGWADGNRSITVFQEDGLQGLLRQLPPNQPRLLVLMDPSYEVKTEYDEVAQALGRAWQKCRHGVYLIWYPILAGRPDERLKAAVRSGPVRKVLCSEILRQQPPERGMCGSGLLVVNPPWGFDDRLAEMLAAAADEQCLAAAPTMEWLVAE